MLRRISNNNIKYVEGTSAYRDPEGKKKWIEI